MGSSKTKTTASSTSQPLQWQEDLIKSAFGDAQGLYKSQQSQGAPDFNTYVGLNGTQTGALNQAVTDAGTQSRTGSLITNAGNQTAQAAPVGTTALTGAAGLAANGAAGNFNQGTTSASNAVMGSTGLNSAVANAALTNAYNQASTDPTASNAANAQTYMNSSGVQQAIKDTNALSDDLYQRTGVSNMNARAVSGGNLNSSRAGAAQAIADSQQQASDKATASSMLTNAYNTGLQLSENARQANLSSLGNTAATGQNGASLGLTAQNDANSQTNANNTLQQNYVSQLGSAGSSLVNAGATGASMATQGSDLTNNADSNALNAGTAYQQADQAQKDANLQAQLSSLQYPWTELQNLYGIVGANNWGTQSNSTSTTTTTPSVGSLIQGGIGSVASLAGAASGSGGLMNLFKKTST